MVGWSLYLGAGQRAFCMWTRERDTAKEEWRKRAGRVNKWGEKRMQKIQVKALFRYTRNKCRNPGHTLVLISL